MATPKEFYALYREGKAMEAKEESPTPTNFFDLLGKAISEAKDEAGKIEVSFNHPTQVRILVFGCTQWSIANSGGGSRSEYFLRRELTHYL